MTVREWLTEATARLSRAGIESASLEAQMLASHVLLLPRTWLMAHPDDEFPDLAGEVLLSRREAQEPLAYILGTREFWGRPFIVRPGVLIPRQDTETLIDWALSLPREPKRVLDIGAGSGCIAITLKIERPEWEVVACDISPRALAIAQENAEALGAEVSFVESDLVSAFGDGSFDLVVSNPPYIGTGESLEPQVAHHEPPEALFAGPEGLDVYRRLAAELPRVMRPAALLGLEIGYRQGEAVSSLFSPPSWRETTVLPDLSGNPRVVTTLWQCGPR